MNYGLTATDIELINAVFASHPPVEEVVIFGSRAMGKNRPGSDIDLAVKGKDITFSDILQLLTELEQLGMLYTFDLQRYDAIKDPEVLSHINRMGKQFYRHG